MSLNLTGPPDLRPVGHLPTLLLPLLGVPDGRPTPPGAPQRSDRPGTSPKWDRRPSTADRPEGDDRVFGPATTTTTKSLPTQNLGFGAHPRRARKVAFYARPPYKKFPFGMTDLGPNIF